MSAEKTRDGVPRRRLGRTGESVSAIGLGGWHLGFKQLDERLSIRIVREAIDRGITFMDNSWDSSCSRLLRSSTAPPRIPNGSARSPNGCKAWCLNERADLIFASS